MKALYMGETYVCKEGEHRTSVTNGKLYDVEQYERIDDPVYGNTFKFIDDNGLGGIGTKHNFITLGKTYDYFDDGKIRESRRFPVTITDIVPFDEIDSETLEYWKDEVNEIDWLYAKETDYFIKGDLDVGDNQIEKITFVRTIKHNDGWFSLGWWAGRLDVDGSLYDGIKNND